MSNRLSQLPLEVLVLSDAPVPARLSQLPLDVLRAPGVEPVLAQLSQLPLEVLVAPPTLAEGRVSQFVAELLSENPPPVPLATTQLAAELLNTIPASPLVATQLAAEVVLALAPQPDQTRVTQLACELIVIHVPYIPPPCAAAFPIDPD